MQKQQSGPQSFCVWDAFGDFRCNGATANIFKPVSDARLTGRPNMDPVLFQRPGQTGGMFEAFTARDQGAKHASALLQAPLEPVATKRRA